MENKANHFSDVRSALRVRFDSGIAPADGRKYIPEALGATMVQELVDSGVPTDATIGVVDTFVILCTHLKEAGYTNLHILDRDFTGVELTEEQQKYYNTTKNVSAKSGIEYHVAKENKLHNLGMNFDVVIGNPPYQNGNHKAKTSSMWKVFLDESFKLSTNKVSLIIPGSFLSPSRTFAQYKEYISYIDVDVKQHFKGVGSSFCRIVLNKKKQDTCTVHSADGDFVVNLKDWDCIPSTFNQEVIDATDKYLSGGRKWNQSYEYETRKKVFSDNGKYEIIHSTKTLRTDVHHPSIDKIKVYCTITNGTKFAIAAGKGLSQNGYWTEVKSMEEAEALVEELNQPELQKLLKVYQFSNMNYRPVISRV